MHDAIADPETVTMSPQIPCVQVQQRLMINNKQFEQKKHISMGAGGTGGQRCQTTEKNS